MPSASAPVVSPRLSPFAALRHRNFRLFYTGQTVSLLGTWMQGLAQGWLVLGLTNSAFWVALVSFLNALPVLLFALPAGAWVDRADKRRLVLRCQALMLLQTLTLTALVASGRVRAWEVGLLAFALGAISAVEIPARQAFIVDLVGKDDLTNAIALNSTAFNATRILGPALAGIIVARVGLVACFALNVLSYAAPLIALRRITLPPWAPAAARADTRAAVGEALRYVREDRAVGALLLATALLSLLGFPCLVLLPVFARDVFGVGAEGLGAMTAAVGIGALVSALGLAALAPRLRRGTLIAWASSLFGLAIAAFALAPAFPLAVLLLAVAGCVMVLNNAATNTLLQSLVPDAMRGRVMALWSLLFVGFAPLGSLLIGWLSGIVGPSVAVALGGGAASVAMVMVWRRTPEVANVR